jgi:hypothetical protein
MADHLPECEPDLQLPDGSFIACICDRLRACEARVRGDWEMSNGPAFEFSRGYVKGLDAARDAVAAVDPDAPGGNMDYGINVQRRALAAIDALRDANG